MRGPIDLVVFRISHRVQKAVMEQCVEIEIHLFRTKVRFGHYVGLFYATSSRHKDVVYDVKFASVL